MRTSGLALSLAIAACAGACSFAWDDYDPLLGAAGSGGAGGDASSTTRASTTSTAHGSSSSSHPSTSSSGGSSTVTTTSGPGGGGGAVGSGGAAPDGTCAAPYVLADDGIANDDTTGRPLDTSSCTTGARVVFEVTAQQDEVLVARTSTSSNADLGIYARSACGQPMTELGCADDAGKTSPEELRLLLTAGEKIFLDVAAFQPGTEGPFNLTLSHHALVCGDSVVDPTEVCDPPNGTDCDMNCKRPAEACADGADNDHDGLTDCEDPDCAASCPLVSDCSAATTLMLGAFDGDTATGTNHFAGSCAGNDLSRENIYKYTAPHDGALLLDLAPTGDLALYVRKMCADSSEANELLCIDHGDVGGAERTAVPMKNGQTYAIFVDGFSGDASAYSLASSFTSSTEAEPNDAAVQANTYAAPYIGTIFGTDEDFVKIVVPEGGTLVAETQGLQPNECDDQAIDTGLAVYDIDGTSKLAENDDFGAGYCSQITLTSLPAGTYFVKVFGYGGAFSYRLVLTVS